MSFKCQNKYCRYGDGYANNKKPTVCDDGTRPEHTREDAYSQNEKNWKTSMYKGLCLNCLDDEAQDAREAESAF